jgi:hypothetical protein
MRGAGSSTNRAGLCRRAFAEFCEASFYALFALFLKRGSGRGDAQR